MLPLLKFANESGSIKLSVATQSLADQFKLTESDRHELLPSGKQTIIANRVGWASTYLKKAGLLKSPTRGHIEITDRGISALSENPERIDKQYLRRYPEFIDFGNPLTQASEEISSIDLNQATPEEILESSYLQLKNQVIVEILERIKTCTPAFFEQLVVDVIVKMGYGGTQDDAGRAIGRSGDEGIDGIINQDRLGLDVIYLQAKRWEANIGRPEIQKFAGALQGKRAKKGVFITTSDFTDEARKYVQNIETKIILISGPELAELMWDYNIGLNSVKSYETKKLDFDYFDE